MDNATEPQLSQQYYQEPQTAIERELTAQLDASRAVCREAFARIAELTLGQAPLTLGAAPGAVPAPEPSPAAPCPATPPGHATALRSLLLEVTSAKIRYVRDIPRLEPTRGWPRWIAAAEELLRISAAALAVLLLPACARHTGYEVAEIKSGGGPVEHRESGDGGASAAPEPSTVLLVGAGLLALVLRRRKPIEVTA